MSAQKLSALLAGQTFALKDDLLSALAALDMTTVGCLISWNGCRLQKVPPAAEDVTALLTACTAKKDTIKDDEPSRSALGRLVTACLEAHSTPQRGSTAPDEAEKALKDASFGDSRYRHLGRKTLSDVPANMRLKGSIIKLLYEDLDRGTLSAGSYKLSSLKGLLTDRAERRSSLGGLSVTVSEEKETALHLVGDVLIAILMLLKALLAAGMRKVTPDPSNPLAGSAGDRGIVKVSGEAGGVERWHLTPHIVDRYLITAIQASSSLSAPEMVAGHNELFRLAIDRIHSNENFESALNSVLNTHSFVTAARLALGSLGTDTTGGGGVGGGSGGGATAAARARRPSSSPRKRQSGSADPGASSGASSPPKKGSGAACWDFNKASGCSRASCKFQHVCQKCGSTEHGQSSCPN